MSQFKRTYDSLCLPSNIARPLVDLRVISPQNSERIRAWNDQIPWSKVAVCIHEIFSEKAHQYPGRMALSAHDGEMTYHELETISTRLAGIIMSRGIRPGAVILIFMEKSLWVPVAQIAIMISGCAAVVLDVTFP